MCYDAEILEIEIILQGSHQTVVGSRDQVFRNQRLMKHRFGQNQTISYFITGVFLASPALACSAAELSNSEKTTRNDEVGITKVTADLHLSAAEAKLIGDAIWRNECGGRIDGLTSWNAGEGFPSLGIGHFIWYRESAPERFEESFPSLLAFLKANHARLPAWLTPETHCPWNSRDQFLRDANGKKLSELRALLVLTVPLQTQFIVQRLKSALPMVLEKVPESDRSKLQERFFRVLHSGSAGTFALVDYVNFKGEGVNEKERYKGEGWGLLQVLQGMSDQGDPLQQFSKSAAAALTNRVSNAPTERHEERWLAGWKKRVANYASFDK